MQLEKTHSYDIGQIKRFLGIFLDRFFKFSQFKRSCIPNCPKIGSGGSLSPRGDYRALGDSKAAARLRQIASIPDAAPPEDVSMVAVGIAKVGLFVRSGHVRCVMSGCVHIEREPDDRTGAETFLLN